LESCAEVDTVTPLSGKKAVMKISASSQSTYVIITFGEFHPAPASLILVSKFKRKTF
jgi:hypothetical protein